MYMLQPPGFEDPMKKEWILHVKKSLYGLKASGREWYKCFRSTMRDKGYDMIGTDLTTFKHKERDVMIMLYVDDTVIFARNEEDRVFARESISSEFKLKDSPIATNTFLGLTLIEKDTGGFWLHQDAYVRKILDEFEFTGGATRRSPMDPKVEAIPNRVPTTLDPECRVRYMKKLGCLNWLAMSSRPNIAYAVATAARLSHNPVLRQEELILDRIFKYLERRPSYWLDLGTDEQEASDERPTMHIYSDADFAREPETMRSVSGTLTMINGRCVAWRAKLQKRMTHNVMEAELIALTEASKLAQGLANFIKEMFDADVQLPMTIFCDNNAARKNSESLTSITSIKHMDHADKLIRERVEAGIVEVLRVPTVDNLADAMTKPLARVNLERFANGIGLVNKARDDDKVENSSDDKAHK